MINIDECCNKYKIKVKKIKRISNYIIIYGDSKNYLLKEKNTLNIELYDYFKKIDYENYLELISDSKDNYELYEYYLDIENFNKEEKLVDTLINLHSKTLSYEEISNIELDDLYKYYDNKINELLNYYLKLQDYIECFCNPRTDYRFLIENISLFYKILAKSKKSLDKLYEKKNLNIRKCYTIDNISLNNFILYDKNYFIDYSKCMKRYIVNDFANFYKEYALNNNIIDLFNLYKKKMNLCEDELDLLIVNICIIPKIEFSNNVSNNISIINEILNYIDKTIYFILEEYEKDKETNK